MNKDPFFERENKKQLDKVLERAKSGDVFAVFTLGEYFHEGILVDKDVDAAAKWYKLAADEGHAGAVEKLQKMFADGEISEMYIPPPYIPHKKKSSNPFSNRNKKSVRKKSYDGNFASDIDAEIVAGIFHDGKDDDESSLDFFSYKNNYKGD